MARDAFHGAVRRALEREEWVVTHDPLGFTFGRITLMLDLSAERLIAVERGLERIAIEVKSFTGLSPVSEFHTAIGQYRNYLLALELRDPTRKLYLAVPESVFETFFQNDFVRYSLQRNEVNVVVYNPETEVIQSWHEWQA
jgi:XisH protein